MPRPSRPCGWAGAPRAVRAQVEGLTEIVGALLGANLVGVYLHGSLAMGCFNPARSDVDLLVVSERPLPRDTKLGLVQTLLARSRHPSPIEISVLARADLLPWRHPTPYQLHCSEEWRARLAADVAGRGWLQWPEAPRTDPDLAAHIVVARRRGVVLSGPPATEIFPEVPPKDFEDAILRDVADATNAVARDPVYVVLNLCRVSRFLRDGEVCSKDEGGAWGLINLPEPLRPVVERALAHYRGDAADPWPEGALAAFAHAMQAEIHATVALQAAAEGRGPAPEGPVSRYSAAAAAAKTRRN